jgi:hypothetical protein
MYIKYLFIIYYKPSKLQNKYSSHDTIPLRNSEVQLLAISLSLADFCQWIMHRFKRKRERSAQSPASPPPYTWGGGSFVMPESKKAEESDELS